MRRAAKVDTNQAEIVEALRRVGASVLLLHRVGQGCPDALCGFRGANVLIEIKAGRGELTDDEMEFFNGWNGQVAVVRTIEEALRLIGAVAL